MNPINPPSNHVFEEARQEFLASLSERERHMLHQNGTADQMIESMRKLDDGSKGRSWTRRVLRCVNSLRDTLEPYFKVVDILVQSHPEYAALVWGSVRLVFQVGVQFA